MVYFYEGKRIIEIDLRLIKAKRHMNVHKFYINFQINLDRKFTQVIIIVILWKHGEEKKGITP